MAYFPPTGSTVAFQSDPTKLVGTVSVVGIPNSSVAVMSVVPHSVATLQGTNPWVVGNSSVMLTPGINTIGSVATLQGTNPWVVQLTSGSVITTGGNSSVMLTQGTNTIGSVTTIQGTNPWVINGSVSGVGQFNVSHTGNGSIITVFSSPSIVGTYAEDAAHADGDKGLFALGVRNDTVASFVSADKDYSPLATDSAGRTLTKPFAPNEAIVTAVSSTVNSQSTSLFAAAGTGLRNYLNNILVANTGSVATLVTFQDGDNSVIGRTIAPAGGGSNILLEIPMRTNGLNQQIHFTAATPVSVLHVSGYGYKAQ